MTDDSEANNAPTNDGAFYRTATEYEPLPDFQPEREEKEYSGEKEGLQQAANDLATAREERRVKKVAEDTPITERNYHYDGGKGDRVPENFTLDAKRAAEDLSRVRQQEAEAASPSQELTNTIDQVRAAWNGEQQPQQQPLPDPQTQAQTAEAPVQEQQQQPQQQQPAHDGIDPEIAEALSRPKVRAALEETVAQVEQARAAYAQGAKEAAQISAAAVLSQWPELASLSAQELPHALAAINKVDPAKAAQIQGALQRTQNLYNAHLQAEQGQQQVRAQQVQQWAAAQDAEFERTVSSKESPEVMHKIAENVVALAEEYGVSKQDLNTLWRNQPIMRSAAFQRMMCDAARYRIASKEAATKIHNPVPPVQRPGISVDRDADTGVERAMAKFKSDPSAKSAAALLIARRAATRK